MITDVRSRSSSYNLNNASGTLYSPKILLPPWVQCVAQDYDGRIFGYEQPPTPAKAGWSAIDHTRVHYLGRGLNNLFWRDTLEYVNPVIHTS